MYVPLRRSGCTRPSESSGVIAKDREKECKSQKRETAVRKRCFLHTMGQIHKICASSGRRKAPCGEWRGGEVGTESHPTLRSYQH